MEETLGKRIAGNRKRLGITQDRLADQLGVTAQAVSKWENDQSCPDITMLPRLAEIFGISTDELLGCTPQEKEPIFEAELVEDFKEDDSQENDGLHFQKGNLEFRFDAGRKSSLRIALWVLLVGGLLLASNILHWDADFWSILWPSGLMIFGLFGLFPRFSFFRFGCALFGGYFLLDALNLFSRDSIGKEYLFPIFLLLFGLSLLADALHRSGHSKVSVHHRGKRQNRFNIIGEESFECSTAFGENSHRIDLPRLHSGIAEVSFGELTVDLSGCEEIAEDCHLDLSCAFGQLNLLVPRCYRVQADSSTAFAAVEYSGHPDPEPQGSIMVLANASFGEICILYI